MHKAIMLAFSKLSVARRELQLHIPKTIIDNVLHNSLRLPAYKIQILREIENADQYTRVAFARPFLITLF